MLFERGGDMKKSKKGLIIPIVCAVVLVLAVVLAIILWPKKSNKEIYTEALKDSFGLSKIKEQTNFGEKSSEVEKLLEEHLLKMVIEGTTKEDGEVSNKNYELYVGKNQFYGLLKNKEENKTLEAVVKDEKLYFTIENILKRYYFIDLKDESNNQILTVDSDKLMTYFFDAFYEVLDEKKLTKSSETITINNKKYSTDKYSYTYNGKDLNETVKLFVIKIKKDKELYKQFENVINSTDVKQEITVDELFDTVLKQADAFKNAGDLFTYAIFLKGDDVISTQISANVPFFDQSIPGALTVNSVVENDKVYSEINVSIMGQTIASLVFNQTSDSNIDIKLVSQGEELMTGKLTADENTLKLKLSGTELLTEKVDLEMIINVVSDTSLNGTISYTSGSESGNYKIKVEEVDKIPQVDVSNNAPYAEMTDEERSELFRLFPDFGGYMPISMDDSFDDDYEL